MLIGTQETASVKESQQSSYSRNNDGKLFLKTVFFSIGR